MFKTLSSLMESFNWNNDLLIVIIPVIGTIVYNFWQKKRDFLLGRKSVAIAIFSEIKEAREELEGLFISWNNLENEIELNNEFKILLVISGDIRMIERIKLEEWHFKPIVISNIISFQNNIYDLYECMRTINSERFQELDKKGKIRLIKMADKLTENVIQKAEAAMSVMRNEFKSIRNMT